jgi:hypothetical protein
LYCSMDSNNPLANLDFQQLLQLAELVKRQTMQQQAGQSSNPLGQQLPVQSSMPSGHQLPGHSMQQPAGQLRPTFPQHVSNESIDGNAGFFEGGMNYSFQAEGSQVQGAFSDHVMNESFERSSMRSPHPTAVVDVEHTSPPPNTHSRRRTTTVSRKGKEAVTEDGTKRVKNSNFHPHEDREIVKAWLEVSCDPMTNTGQTKETFWSKVYSLYNSRRGNFPERSTRSVQSRWDVIKKECHKFAGYHASAVRRNPSGMTDADKVL